MNMNTKTDGRIQAIHDTQQAKRELSGKFGASPSWVVDFTLSLDMHEYGQRTEASDLFRVGYIEGLEKAIKREESTPTPIISDILLAVLRQAINKNTTK